MQEKILILIPVKKNMDLRLRQRCFETVLNIQTYFLSHVDIRIDGRGPGDSMFNDFCGHDRVSNLAGIRQNMVNDYLKPEHTHVMMLDADVLITPDVILRLLRTSKTDIVAPAILGEGNRENEWYDTWAFFDKSEIHFNRFAPHYLENGVVELSCVGTVYIMPAEIFRRGCVYMPMKGYTEHFSICLQAKELGIKTLCNQHIIVRHPRLDDYGEKRE